MSDYSRKILRVDLTSQKIDSREPDKDVARKFIGGAGLAARIIWDETGSDTQPFSAETPFVFMIGPLTGTAVPSSSRYTVSTLSPLTGMWGGKFSIGRYT